MKTINELRDEIENAIVEKCPETLQEVANIIDSIIPTCAHHVQVHYSGTKQIGISFHIEKRKGGSLKIPAKSGTIFTALKVS